ncbi:MAG: DsbA family protein [Chloroflexi bacterium]|nr:DsbA family protein [Chloroflexota bacterium]
MKEQIGDELQINWRYFSLEQVNSDQGPDWKLWEQPADYRSRGRLAFHAAEAARRQGREAFDRFHMALLKARHEQAKKIFEMQTLLDTAREAGLDLPRFEADLANPALLEKLREDHTYAVEKYGVFGTPTLVLTDGRAAYLKMKPAAPYEESVAVWHDLHRTIAQRPYVEEVKRPVPPPGA